MPPITGFYAFVAGTVLFALLGSNPQMSVGADSTIAPLFATGVAALAITGSPHYVDLVGILAVMVGLIVMLVSLLRLGWIAEFLSTPIVTGFLSGVAVIIIVHQLPDFLGLPAYSGTNQHRIGQVVTHLGDANAWTAAIGAGVLAVTILTVRFDRRIPGALIGLVGSTALVAALDLQAHGVAVLGPITSGVPSVGLHGLSWSDVQSLAPLAAVVALVIVTQTAATTRAFAEQGGYDIDAGRDFLAVGAGSVVAGLVGSFPVDASPPRTGAVVTAGGRTQAGLLGAAAVVVVLIPIAGVLKDVPLATLAAVLIFIALRLFHVHDLMAIARFDLVEFALAAITLLAVVFVGVEQGIAAAVILAMLDRIRFDAAPPAARARACPREHQLDTVGGQPRCGAAAGRAGRPLRHADLVRQRRALQRGGGGRRGRARSDTGAGPRHAWHVGHRLHRLTGAGPRARCGRPRPHPFRRRPRRRPPAHLAAAVRARAPHRPRPFLSTVDEAVTSLTAGPTSPA